MWGHLQSRDNRVVLLPAGRKFGLLPYTCSMKIPVALRRSPRPWAPEPEPSLNYLSLVRTPSFNEAIAPRAATMRCARAGGPCSARADSGEASCALADRCR